MQEQGYIKMYRKFIDWEWYTDIKTKSLFVHCLLKANHIDKKWRGESIKRGTFITSLDKLKTQTGLSKQEIRTSLKKLISTGDLTNQSTNLNRLITVCNYDEYQTSNTPPNIQLTGKQQTTNIQLTPTNNEKNLKNEKNDKKVTKRFVRPSIQDLENYCNEKDYKIDCTNFFNHYESNGWMVGKVKMKNWKATLATWNARNKKDNSHKSNASFDVEKSLFGDD